jgi:hypothetical protein
MSHVWERRKMCTRFWWEIPREREHLEDKGIDGIRTDLRKIGWGVWIGFSWLRMGCCECGDEPSGGSGATELVDGTATG